MFNLFSVLFYKIKLVNINVSDIIDGRPSIILGLIWTIILHCHVSLVDSCSHCACWAVMKKKRETEGPIPSHEDETMMKCTTCVKELLVSHLELKVCVTDEKI